jgi:hypothetical protein
MKDLLSRRKWEKLWHLPRREKILLLEAAVSLAAARLAISILPFRYLAAWLGEVGGESPLVTPAAQEQKAQQLGWAVESMANYTPWNITCLVQALAADWMLRRRGLAGTLYLGVAKDCPEPFTAHAWCRYGGRLLTGGRMQQHFQVLVHFSRIKIDDK